MQNAVHSQLKLLPLMSLPNLHFANLSYDVILILLPPKFNGFSNLVAITLFNFPLMTSLSIFLPFSYWVFKAYLQSLAADLLLYLTYSSEWCAPMQFQFKYFEHLHILVSLVLFEETNFETCLSNDCDHYFFLHN